MQLLGEGRGRDQDRAPGAGDDTAAGAHLVSDANGKATTESATFVVHPQQAVRGRQHCRAEGCGVGPEASLFL